MESVANVDRLVVLLRQRLQERARASGAGRKGGREAAGRAAGGLARVQEMAAVDGVDDHQLGRALIQSILADQFGPELINETKFQQVVDQVTETLEAEAEPAKLLRRVVGELRASAR